MNPAINRILQGTRRRVEEQAARAGGAEPVSEARRTLRMALGKGTTSGEVAASRIEREVVDGIEKAAVAAFSS